MLVDTRDDTLATHLLARGAWEIHVTECIAAHVSAGNTVVDVGANYGYFSLLMGCLAGPKGRLHSIEANPHLADLLRTSLFRNGMRPRSQIDAVALSDGVREDAWFRASIKTPMNGRLVGRKPADSDHPDLVVRRVPVTTLDELIPPGTAVDFMKVDIEGAERAFWTGARRVIAESPKIRVLLEVNSRRYQDPLDFYAEIQGQGFKLQVLNNDGSISRITSDELMQDHSSGHHMLFLER